MKLLTLIIVVFSVVLLTGCEKQFLSPIKEPIMECMTEEPIAGIPYEVTEVLVWYDEETWVKQTSPIATVNDFLISKGYTPEVKKTVDTNRTEIIVIDFDLRPVLEELTTIPGVVSVRPHNEYIDAFKHEPGIILVAYNEKTWAKQTSPISSVHNFLVCKGYTPKVVNLIPGSYTEVIDIGHWNIFPIMEELAQLPEVEYVQPNFIYSFHTGDVKDTPEPEPASENPALEAN